MAFAGQNIISHDYDSIEEKLSVYFLGGGRYDFESVPYSVYSELLLSKKKSEVFNEKIKDKFKFTKIY